MLDRIVRKKLKLEDVAKESDFSMDLMNSFKEKFPTSDIAEKYKMLTCIPDCWTIQEIRNFFGVTDHMARKSKILKREKGAFSAPEKKMGKKISEDIKNKVMDFYRSDEISRICPGKKDCISVQSEGSRKRVQKRLLLVTCKEAYVHFKQTYSGIKLGVSLFTSLKPKEVISPGASGTHSVCVCQYHQNIKLKIVTTSLHKSEALLINTSETEVTYKHLLARLVCNPSRRECYLDKCDQCPDSTDLGKT